MSFLFSIGQWTKRDKNIILYFFFAAGETGQHPTIQASWWVEGGISVLKCLTMSIFKYITDWIDKCLRETGNRQNWKVLEFIFMPNWKVSESESVRIGKCQNWKVSELESVRIAEKCPVPFIILTRSNLRSFWHFPVRAVSDTFQSEQFLTLSNLSSFWHFPISAVSDTFQFWHFPIWAVSDTFQSQQFLTLSNSDTFQSQHFLTLSNSDTFQSKQVLTLSKLSSFWQFPILTLSDSNTFQFWHFPILTLFNFAQNGQKMDSDTFQFWHFLISRV